VSDNHVLPNGQVLVNVHEPYECVGENCTIHDPSDHHMKDWPQEWDQSRRIMMRVCSHGDMHIDPDEPGYLSCVWDNSQAVPRLVCDACCYYEEYVQDIEKVSDYLDGLTYG
jgi:hypothetical protein